MQCGRFAVLPLENNHKQIRKNLIEKMEINTFSLYLKGTQSVQKAFPRKAWERESRITEKVYRKNFFTKKITNLSGLKYKFSSRKEL
jgi:hypothetical protein